MRWIASTADAELKSQLKAVGIHDVCLPPIAWDDAERLSHASALGSAIE
jgi:hypothetical protein